MGQPVCIHPDNPKLFLFRGRPLVAVTATEHYGAVMNRPFRFERYLDDAGARGLTLTRLFVLFRELQAATNPYSTCKPESPDYIAPFARTGPGAALDGQPRFDLDRDNPEFYDRLHRFVAAAGEKGILVEVTLLSNTYGPHIWALNPLHAANNVNALPEIPWPDYTSLRHPEVYARQARHVRRIARELNGCDNVFFEICNEPGGQAPAGPGVPTVDEVNAWQGAIAAVIRETEAILPNRHLVAGQEAFRWEPFEQTTTRTFRDFPVDIVNVHPLPATTFDGQTYDMGAFMSGQLRLRAVRDYCLATFAEPRPLNLDEDNAASQYKDEGGWTVHRKRAWVALVCGAHYDYIDFSIINYCEAGTAESRRGIRGPMGHLARFMHSLDLAAARPLPGIVRRAPRHALDAAFGVPGRDVAVYLADERETGEAGCGEPLEGPLEAEVGPGHYRVAALSPATGEWSPALRAEGPVACVDLPPFRHDVLVRFTRA
ncbi:MAG: cellulase family glycosylhydrolase [Chthonomonadales bacterium]|nr:cellulase family glycosylhydrolase [Chthonomonadales bacterium]